MELLRGARDGLPDRTLPLLIRLEHNNVEHPADVVTAQNLREVAKLHVFEFLGTFWRIF